MFLRASGLDSYIGVAKLSAVAIFFRSTLVWRVWGDLEHLKHDSYLETRHRPLRLATGRLHRRWRFCDFRRQLRWTALMHPREGADLPWVERTLKGLGNTVSRARGGNTVTLVLLSID